MALRSLALYGQREQPQLGESISRFSPQSDFKRKLFLQEDYFITQRLPSSEEEPVFRHTTELNWILVWSTTGIPTEEFLPLAKISCRNRHRGQNHNLYINLYLCCRTCNYTVLQQLKMWCTNCIWHANWILLANKFLVEKNTGNKQM